MKLPRAYLLREMREYLATVPDVVGQELVALKDFVQQGNSPYSNPSHVADEKGWELPFIHALRAERELAERIENNVSKPTE